MPLGLYISVPFCPTKCSYCNFATGVVSRAAFSLYVDRVTADIAAAEALAHKLECSFERHVDSIYLGGGTPSILEPADLERLFASVRGSFDVRPGAEVTVECAPGTLTPALVQTLAGCGVNRVSLGVQSFVDREAAAVGRRHSHAVVLDDIARLRAAGITAINVDLIAGLPHQSTGSWDYSVAEAAECGVSHVSVYILEVDEDSRLGRELIAGGRRYHAHHVPNEDLVAGFYQRACHRLEQAGIAQYEISNFARPGCQSRHNLKYWTRQPYLGFGVDAHSMLLAGPNSVAGGVDAMRFAMPNTLESFLGREPAWQPAVEYISQLSAMEETFFLGLRLNRGVSLREAAARFGQSEVDERHHDILDLLEAGLVRLERGVLKLTPRGRLLSNEVFDKFVAAGTLADLPDILNLDPDDPRRALLKPEKIH
jgi:oxygen-independent coproporphyrinogen III oxidase